MIVLWGWGGVEISGKNAFKTPVMLRFATHFEEQNSFLSIGPILLV